MPYCDKKVISFLLTTHCNLRCTYCYGARNVEKRVLDYNFAHRVIEDYMGGPGGIKQIRFFADGEPTTEIELLKRIYYEVKVLEPDVQAEIQSNGVFTTETADWLAKNMDYIWMSIDLLPEDHDRYRMTSNGKPSSPMILKNLQYFKDMPRKAKIGIRSTITKFNIERQKEGIDYYHKNYGIDIFWVDPIFPPVSDMSEKTYEPIDMMQFATTFVDAHNHAWANNIFYESNLTTNFDGKTNKACRSCLPMPHLTMDGYLSACEMATYGEDAGKMDAMIYAQYDAKNDKIIYDENKLKILKSRTLQNMPLECRSCAAGEHCAGFCLGETLNENGSLFRVKTRVCRALRYIYGEIGHLYPKKFPKGFPHKHP